MWQVVEPQSHLMPGLSIAAEPMATPLHNSPLIFQLLDAEMLHLRKMEFKIFPAITVHIETVWFQ